MSAHYAATGIPLPIRLLPYKTEEPRALAVLQGTRPVTEAGTYDVLSGLANLADDHPLRGLYSLFGKVDPESEEVSLYNIVPEHRDTFVAHAKAWLEWNYTNRKLYEEFIRSVLSAFKGQLKAPVYAEDVYAVEMLVYGLMVTANNTEVVEATELQEEAADASA